MRLYKLPRKLCTTDCRLSFPSRFRETFSLVKGEKKKLSKLLGNLSWETETELGLAAGKRGDTRLSSCEGAK